MDRYYIHKYEVAQCYGGPEEGGWFYDSGVPVEDWDTTAMIFTNEDQAYIVCRALNAAEHERAKDEEKYDYTSVLSHQSTHYSYSVEDTPRAEAYPKGRPHYE